MCAIVFHEYLSALYGCARTQESSCYCKDLVLEQLVFTLQASGLCDRFCNFVSSLEFQNIPVGDAIYHSLSSTHPILSHLESFLILCEHVNKTVHDFLTAICRSSKDDFLVRVSKARHEIQSAVCSVMLPSLACTKIRPLLEAYLCLELEASEVTGEKHNIFHVTTNSSLDDGKLKLLEQSRLLSNTCVWFTMVPSYASVFLPYAKAALTCRIRSLCSENYSERLLDPILEYKDEIMRKLWLCRVFNDTATQNSLASQLTDEMIYFLFYEVRKPDIFSLIIEFPDSIGALMDLGKCLEHVPFRQSLISHLTEVVKQRLLHPGVHTEQILVAYSYLVRALRLVDKSYLVQDVVCRPVSLCLRQREDAVRCIVDKLLSNPDQEGEDSYDLETFEMTNPSTELYSELLLRKPLEVEPADGAEDIYSEFVAEDPAFDEDTHDGSRTGETHYCIPGWGNAWQPDPVEAVHQGGLWRRRMDLLSMLVSIYGSKKAFIVEYKQLLSQRLLKQRSFHIAHEMRNLELLKLRFGEQNLVECEVMLKDIRDSKRIATLVSEVTPISSANASSTGYPFKSDCTIQLRSTSTVEQTGNEKLDVKSTGDLFPLSAYILSLHYWPELLDERFKLPEGLRDTFVNYERTFQRLKGNRTLQWMHKLGLVNIELELGNRRVQLDVTPLQASMAYLFTLKRSWGMREIAQELETVISTVRSGLHAFVQLGFLRKRVVPGEMSVRDSHAEVFEVCDPSADDKPSPDIDCRGPPNSKIIRSSVTSKSWLFPKHADEDESIVSTVRDRKEKELQVFWSYIVAMLTNLGGLSLDRIHSMLGMFALGSTSGLECTRDELRQFLDKRMCDSELIFDGEVYKLSKIDT